MSEPETIEQAMAQADAEIAMANGGVTYNVTPGHNHTDAWPCNASCPAHPEFTAHCTMGQADAEIQEFIANDLREAVARVDAAIAEANGNPCMMCGAREGSGHWPGCPRAGGLPPLPPETAAHVRNMIDVLDAQEGVTDFDVALELTQSLEAVKSEMDAKDARIAELEEGCACLVREKAATQVELLRKNARIAELESQLDWARNSRTNL